jgi:hypothetical protein
MPPLQTWKRSLEENPSLSFDHQITPQHPFAYTSIIRNQLPLVEHAVPPVLVKNRKPFLQVYHNFFALLGFGCLSVKHRFATDNPIYSTGEVYQQGPSSPTRHIRQHKLVGVVVMFVKELASPVAVNPNAGDYIFNTYVRLLWLYWQNSLRVQTDDVASPQARILSSHDLL